MFFKNAVVYQLTQPADVVIKQLRNKLETRPFEPCGPHSAVSTGFIPPHSEALGLTHEHTGIYLFRVKQQVKNIPASAVSEMLEDEVAEIEANQNRKVYRKERQVLRDEIVARLLPNVIPTSKSFAAYIDRQINMVVVDASSYKAAEVVLNLVRDTLGGFPVRLPVVENSPPATWTHWLTSAPPEHFRLGTDCTLATPGDDGAEVKLRRYDLHADTVEQLINEGNQVNCLRVLWRDGDLVFTFEQPCLLKSLLFTDKLIMESAQEVEGEDQAFDANVALMAGTLRDLLHDIAEAFGGIMEQEFLNLEGDAA